MNQNTPSHYDALSRAFHWLTAIAVAIAFVLGPEGFGRLMRDGVDPATRSDIVWHESLGILVFVLTLLRLIWVALRPAVPRLETGQWLPLLAKLVHLALWTLLLVLPMTALLALGSEGHPLTVLGGVRVNHMPLIADSAIAKMADWGDLHGLLGNLLIWLSGLHAVAAIYHHVFLKDGVLLSMLPKSSR